MTDDKVNKYMKSNFIEEAANNHVKNFDFILSWGMVV